MKANELRIGNIVFQGEESGNAALNSYQIYQLQIYQDDGQVADYYADFEPIPLTEEWLLKFGFLNEDSGDGFIQWNKKVDSFLTICIADSDLSLELMALGESVTPNIIISSVHQLQNLYFALTGTELEIK